MPPPYGMTMAGKQAVDLSIDLYDRSMIYRRQLYSTRSGIPPEFRVLPTTTLRIRGICQVSNSKGWTWQMWLLYKKVQLRNFRLQSSRKVPKNTQKPHVDSRGLVHHFIQRFQCDNFSKIWLARCCYCAICHLVTDFVCPTFLPQDFNMTAINYSLWEVDVVDLPLLISLLTSLAMEKLQLWSQAR